MAERAKKTKNPATAIPTASQTMRTQSTCRLTCFAKSGSRPRSLRSERHMVVARAGTMTSAIRGARGPAWSVKMAPINVTTTATTPDATLPRKRSCCRFFLGSGMGLLSGEQVRPTRGIVEPLSSPRALSSRRSWRPMWLRNLQTARRTGGGGRVTAKRDRRGKGRSKHQSPSMMFNLGQLTSFL